VQHVAALGRHHHEHRQLVCDQRDRPVLELAGGESLGVDVGQFLQFQGAFEGHRIADVATEEEHRGLIGEIGGELQHRSDVVQHRGDGRRHRLQLGHGGFDLVTELGAADLGEVEAEQVAGH
jgi:hypothetical protein